MPEGFASEVIEDLKRLKIFEKNGRGFKERLGRVKVVYKTKKGLFEVFYA